MILFEDISKSYGENPLFAHVSFSIGKGEKVGLVGRNGSGKTTLFRLITTEEPCDGGRIYIPKGYRIGYLKQHLKLSEPTVLEEGALALQEEESHQHYKVEKILQGLGFSKEQLEQPPSLLSGGFQVRLSLAKALIAEPDCLLLDEPTNYLDIVSIRWLGKFLESWPKECLIISHDRSFLDQVTTHSIMIHRSSIKKQKGKVDDLYRQILIEEELHEKTRQNLEQKKAKVEQFIDRFGAKATKASQAESRKKMLSKMPSLEKLNDLKHLNFNFNYFESPAKRLLHADNLSFSYDHEDRATPHLIHRFSLEVEIQDRIAIIGKNGEGKSTLLKLMASQIKPLQGQLLPSPHLRIGYFGQTNIDRLDKDNTIFEEIAKANPLLAAQEVLAIAGAMMFSKDAQEKKINVLSGGEKSRVLLGKILASSCNLLLLDEPTHHLDLESIEALKTALESFKGAYIFVTHNEDILSALPFNKIVHVKQNAQQLLIGGYEDFLSKMGWEEPEIFTKENKVLKKDPSESLVLRNHLKVLKNKISKTEKAIETKEEDLKKEEDRLMKASFDSKAKEIAETSKIIKVIQEELALLFEDWEKESEELEKLKSELLLKGYI